MDRKPVGSDDVKLHDTWNSTSESVVIEILIFYPMLEKCISLFLLCRTWVFKRVESSVTDRKHLGSDDGNLIKSRYASDIFQICYHSSVFWGPKLGPSPNWKSNIFMILDKKFPIVVNF